MALNANLSVLDDCEIRGYPYKDDTQNGGGWWVGKEVGGEWITSRALVKFDVSGISHPTTVITSAVFRAYAYDYSADYHSLINILRNTSNFSEENATWNNRPGTDQNFGETDTTNTGWKSLSMNNSYVQYWARGTWSNYGVTLKTRNEDADKVGFRSKDYSDSNYHPYLDVSYYYKPAVSTSSYSGIGTGIATLTGNITDVHGKNCDVRGFQYGLSETPTWTINESGSFGTGSYSLTPDGLFSGRKYYFRAYATNDAGTDYGGWQSFRIPQLHGGMV